MKDFLEQPLITPLTSPQLNHTMYLFNQFRAHWEPHANDGDCVVVFPLVCSHGVGHTLLSVPL
jgi:hypothetical protein